MRFLWLLQEALILINISIIYVQANVTISGGDRYTTQSNKLSYNHSELRESETTEIWKKILSNPRTSDEEIFKAIKQGEYYGIFHYTLYIHT